MEWTKEQQKAIDARGKNLLVAAAAGSGKTAVLVERIKQLVLKDRCSMDRMLIVTFTNAAAAEMKEKIRKSLNKAAGETDNREELLFLKKQLELLPTANISTFHAFALEVLHRFFYVIGAEPNMKICDNGRQTILMQEAMDKLLDELFEENSTDFITFLKKYSGERNEEKFKNIIGNTYKTIISLPKPYVWLHENVELLAGEDFKNGKAMDYLWQESDEKIAEACRRIEDNFEIGRTMGFAELEALNQSDENLFRRLGELIKNRDFDEMAETLSTVKFTSLTKKYFKSDLEELNTVEAAEAEKKIKDNREAIKASAKNLKENFFYLPLEELMKEVRDSYEDGIFLEKAVTRYRDLYDAGKRVDNLIDFSDIEHFAYTILQDPEVSKYYREKFDHIFIDEYQDSNVIQEALIDRVKGENNLFMVGDVKQSIYKFRLAEPEIFQGKYKLYASGDDKNSEKIDLNKNFRSKKSVVDFINKIFCETMQGYDANAALYMGDVFGEKNNYSPMLYLANVPWDEENSVDDELKNIMKTEKEALAAVKIIRDSLGKTIFDSKSGAERPLEKRDIVILMRAVREYGDIFYNVLTENNIPAYIDDNDGFLNTMEINTIMSLLLLIDNEKQDVPLLTVLRSEIFGFTVTELASIRLISHKSSFYDALKEYGEKGEDEALKEKCCGVFGKLAVWREEQGILPLDELVWKLILDTGFYVIMGAMPAGSQRQANLRALVDKALSYRKSGNGSLYGFVSYMDAVKEEKVPMGQVKLLGDDDDNVRIMTIHKSKGLEFPMVIVAGYAKKLNYSKGGRDILIHKDLGIGFPTVNYEQHWYRSGLVQNIINSKIKKEEVEEQKRVLYVAMTRAKDILYMLGICDVEKTMEKLSENEPSDNSYLEMTGRNIISSRSMLKRLTDADFCNLSKVRFRMSKAGSDLLESEKTGEVPEEIKKRMTYTYEYEDELKLKSKYSVSELNMGEKPLIESIAVPLFAQEKKTLTAAQVGTAVHKVLEVADFALIAAEGKKYLDTVMDMLVRDEFLTAEEGKAVDLEKLISFAASPLGKRIIKSPGIHKEQQFNLIRNMNGNEITVQGIIDCYFEEAGELVLVDYKTSHIRAGSRLEEELAKIKERYKLQMDIYKEALETATGKTVKSAYLYLTNLGEVVEM